MLINYLTSFVTSQLIHCFWPRWSPTGCCRPFPGCKTFESVVANPLMSSINVTPALVVPFQRKHCCLCAFVLSTYIMQWPQSSTAFSNRHMNCIDCRIALANQATRKYAIVPHLHLDQRIAKYTKFQIKGVLEPVHFTRKAATSWSKHASESI